MFSGRQFPAPIAATGAAENTAASAQLRDLPHEWLGHELPSASFNAPWTGILLFMFAASLTAHDWSIVPGKRVGPVTAVSTEADLKSAFGPSAVKAAEIRIDDKTASPGVEIYAGKPGESLAVVWLRKDAGLRWPLLVIPCYAQTGVDCRWRTAEGVRVGMSIAALETLNQKPFLLYPDVSSKVWTYAWWSGGKLAERLDEDVELQFDMHRRRDHADEGYIASNQEPLAGSELRVRRMFVHLLSGRARASNIDWTIGGPTWSAIETANTELLRESLGADQVHRTVEQGEEGIGEFPGVSVFPGDHSRSVVTSEAGTTICGGFDGYSRCQWRVPEPFALIMTVKQVQNLNGRPFLFNGFGWDYGGVITSWDGGKLEKDWPGAKPPFVSCKGEYPDRMSGDGHTVRSDDPDLAKLNCSVLYR
jgi:hypothetical protein